MKLNIVGILFNKKQFGVYLPRITFRVSLTLNVVLYLEDCPIDAPEYSESQEAAEADNLLLHRKDIEGEKEKRKHTLGWQRR